MSQPWSSIAYAVVPVLSAFGGILISDARQQRRERAARLEVRRGELRDALTEFLVAVEDLIDSEWLMIPAIAKMSLDDMHEFVETDTGKGQALRGPKIKTALMRARLIVDDPELAGRMDQFKELFTDYYEVTRNPIGPSKPQREREEGIFEAFKHLKVLRSSMTFIEKRAIELLRVDAVAGKSGG